MTEATEKQIAYAQKLGIEGAETFSKEALREVINQKVGKSDGNSAGQQKVPQSGSNNSNQGRETQVETQVHINKTERANSYEFGKSGDRFKIYFEDANDLKAKMDDLKAAGLVSDSEETPSV